MNSVQQESKDNREFYVRKSFLSGLGLTTLITFAAAGYSIYIQFWGPAYQYNGFRPPMHLAIPLIVLPLVFPGVFLIQLWSMSRKPLISLNQDVLTWNRGWLKSKMVATSQIVQVKEGTLQSLTLMHRAPGKPPQRLVLPLVMLETAEKSSLIDLLKSIAEKNQSPSKDKGK